MRRINFKTLLFVTSMVGLVGCGNTNEEVSRDEYVDLGNIQKKKVEELYSTVYKIRNNCYMRTWRNVGSLSILMVDMIVTGKPLH